MLWFCVSMAASRGVCGIYLFLESLLVICLFGGVECMDISGFRYPLISGWVRLR